VAMQRVTSNVALPAPVSATRRVKRITGASVGGEDEGP
jgi:hypothetical protein